MYYRPSQGTLIMIKDLRLIPQFELTADLRSKLRTGYTSLIINR
jgi:hypothetical protein